MAAMPCFKNDDPNTEDSTQSFWRDYLLSTRLYHTMLYTYMHLPMEKLLDLNTGGQ